MSCNTPMTIIEKILCDLLVNVQNEDTVGYDPFDGLNSRFFRSLPFSNKPIFRLLWIQFFKHCPINLRTYLGVPKTLNPKAIGLLLLGMLRRVRAEKKVACPSYSQKIIRCLHNNLIYTKYGFGFGYNFDWQSKAFFVPKGTPNTVTSVYVGHALLDFYETCGDQQASKWAQGVHDFLLNEMVMWEKEDFLCFSYIPHEKAEVHNANLLAAAFLSRIYAKNENQRLKEMITKAVRFSISDIQENGYWPYGTMPHHRWMDNFHTGFNLESLLQIRTNLNTHEYDKVIKKVYAFYRANFFLDNGIPRYYNNKTYPIDIHNIAESIIILNKVASNDSALWSTGERNNASVLLRKVMAYAFTKFWDKKGYFYYQRGKVLVNKINYMRWSQAWMFYALNSCLHVDISARAEFFGVGLDLLTVEETLSRIEEIILARKPVQHVVINVAKLVMLQKDAQLKEIINKCGLVNVDGQGVVWGARILGLRIPERVAGIDLMLRLVKLSSTKGYSIYLLGATQEVIDTVVRIWHRAYPTLLIAGYRNGYFGENEEAEVVSNIRDSKADILFVAMSSPKKEIFLNKYHNEFGVPFLMGVGGSFDVVAGKTKRAPVWMQSAGLEWFYRLMCEPKRMWKRYLTTNLVYVAMLIKAFIRKDYRC